MSIPAAKMRQTRGFCIMETGYAVEKITDGLLEAIRGAMELDSKLEQEAYPLSWFAGGLYGLVDEWMRRGMVTSPDELEAMSRENSE